LAGDHGEPPPHVRGYRHEPRGGRQSPLGAPLRAPAWGGRHTGPLAGEGGGEPRVQRDPPLRMRRPPVYEGDADAPLPSPMPLPASWRGGGCVTRPSGCGDPRLPAVGAGCRTPVARGESQPSASSIALTRPLTSPRSWAASVSASRTGGVRPLTASALRPAAR